jgi:hypothetical protein
VRHTHLTMRSTIKLLFLVTGVVSDKCTSAFKKYPGRDIYIAKDINKAVECWKTATLNKHVQQATLDILMYQVSKQYGYFNIQRDSSKEASPNSLAEPFQDFKTYPTNHNAKIEALEGLAGAQNACK